MTEAPNTESSSNGSPRSTTPNSTSTYQFSHEPFETFRKKVEALARDIKSKSFDNIVRIPGGSFNRIIAADLHSYDTSSALQKVVLRIPRFIRDEDLPYKDILNQCSILEAIAKFGIQVPRVLAYDCTSSNALGMPFSLQTRLEGQKLDFVYGEMTLSERFSIASELVRILAAMERVKFQSSGRLGSSRAVPNRKKIDEVDDSSASDILKVEGFGVGVGWFRSKTTDSTPTSLQELLSTQLDGWLQHELSNDHKSFVADMFKRLKDIQAEMDETLSLTGKLLFLPDASETHHIQITGVLDWDDALSVPPVLARKPPVWLWDFSDDETLPSSVLAHYDGDFDILPAELYNEAGDCLSEADIQVKKFFESEIAEKLYGDSSPASREAYFDDAYGRGRWLRRLWRFALEGFSDNQHIDRFKEFDRAWSEYRETQPTT
ncbi:hypothetical protein KCU92_g4089, partial [Aureobasidium melanogenum]